jgi:thioredoxin-like negative regulator of GroEL
MDGNVRYVNDTQLEELLIEEKGWVAIAFLDRSSIPCDHFWPEFKLYAKHAKKVRCVRLDVSENPTLTAQLGVTAVPTTLLFKDSDEVARYEGPYSHEALQDRIGTVISKGKK